MFVLYHHWISGLSRAVRVGLAEKQLHFELVPEEPWQGRDEFLAMNPSGELPVMVEERGASRQGLTVGTAILEYIDEKHVDRGTRLYPGDPHARAEVRRLVHWFEGKFEREVVDTLVGEKLVKRLSKRGHPDGARIRAGRTNMRFHMDYISYLVHQRDWIAGPRMSAADIVAAGQVSTLDLIGEIPWDDFPDAREWYLRIKSRPSFRPILADAVQAVNPPQHYADLDA
jgi:glutathione S-transferase